MRLGYVPDIPTNDLDNSAVSRSIFIAARAFSHSFFPFLMGGRVGLCTGGGILSLSTPDVLATLMFEEGGRREEECIEIRDTGKVGSQRTRNW